MQFVSYDSDSGTDNDDGNQAVIPPPTKPAKGSAVVNPNDQVSEVTDELPAEWLNAHDSSSDDETAGTVEAPSTVGSAPKKFDDVATLLSTITDKPKFLKKKIDEDAFVIAESRSHNYDAADKTYTEARNNNNRSTAPKQPAAPVRIPRSGLQSATSNTTKSSGLQSKQEKDKETAKVGYFVYSGLVDALCLTFSCHIYQDRVKRQRLGGQSGIGSDFREWRSEEEMRQRQQYD
jgi:hypothetical protein